MKPFFLSLALLLATGLLTAAPAHAQFLWQRPVGTAANDESAAFAVPVAGGVVTLGISTNNVTYPPEGVYLSKVDLAGNLVWAKRQAFARVNVLYPRALFADAAGNLVVSLIAVPPAPPGPAPFSQGLLVKFNALGDTLWTRRVRAPASNAALDVAVPGNDGSYVAIGDYGPTLPALFKFSPAGTLLWSQVIPYSPTRQGYLQNLVAVPNGYLLISGPVGGNLKSKYIAVDESGAYLSERMAGLGYPYRLQTDSQGNVLALGGSLEKRTAQGDSIWSRSYRQFGQYLSINRLVELPNGNYLAAGARYNGTDDDLGLVLADANGNRLRDTLLVRYQSDENAAGLALTPAGDYVVALGTTRGPLGGADQLVFAYRNWARLLPARTAAAAPAPLTAYPNPAADQVRLQGADGRPAAGPWVLFDPLGRPVLRGTLAGRPGEALSLATLPPGLYLLRLTDPQTAAIHTLRLQKQ